MTKEEVKEKLREFEGYLEREMELKEELLSLKLRGNKATEQEVLDKLAHHDDLVAEIERIREENMLPILDELMKFIASKTVDVDTVL
ncbi:MAG: hypothetical protein HYU64_02410 [Armatimonadetes bacterium]|nr:hypothetical protein [Armatimonadota bacterium]